MTRDRSSIRTGIVGLGNIGQYHGQRLLDTGVSLVGGVDIDPRAREQFERRYDAPTYDRGDPLYESVDALVVTTPNEYHEPYAVEALERDIHVLIEKPLAHTVESAERIVEAAADSEAACMVGFNNRFSNTVAVIRDRIDRGKLGDVRHVEANYVRRRGVPGRGTWFTHRERAGGGALIDLGVHAIDLALYVLDFPAPTVVLGRTRSDFGRRDDYVYLEMWGEDAGPESFDVEDSASAFVRTDTDQTISLEVAWATNRPATHEFVVHGTEAAAKFDLIEHDLTIHRARTNGPAALEDTSVRTRDVDTHRKEQQVFFDAILDGEDPSNVAEAFTVQRIIQAIYRSSKRGEAVSLS
ncbi:oxidoreductase domain-containing protein [Halovivax asiaticus JCM 14624]|uniref:Oxidoreductase domain-containing protein n=1 Tax=Halovivax asiaticus JCM 14624 TaxID=1227490 RepID=M0BUT6_9EURY|nr:Gfo/Idh/MocA family oxidoreductase [Halovivax asiaticus]ELZ13414.1 oxidoreductase domain-containing protein [Halovivax asiaticus JCM 14624]